MGTSTGCPYCRHLVTTSIQLGKKLNPAHPELLKNFTIQMEKAKFMPKNGDQKMRNGPTASATDTAMRNSWNEKKKHQCKLINFGRTSACFKQILRIL